MKKLLFVGSVVAAMASFADTEITAATVGVTSISSSYKHTIIAMSYQDLSGSGNLAVSNLVKTTNLTAGDKLYTFKDGNFECWNLSAAGGIWQHQTTQYTINSSGEIVVAAGTEASDEKKPVGTGIWLVRQSTTNPIVIYGNPASTTSYTLDSAGTFLVGNPTQSAKVPTITTPVTGDVILLPNDSNMPTRYRFNGTNWSYVDTSTHKPTSGSAPSIPAGTGFWYQVAGAGVTISW